MLDQPEAKRLKIENFDETVEPKENDFNLVNTFEYEHEQIMDKIDDRFEYIHEEVDIRIESMKAMLDNARESFFKRLDEEKALMKKNVGDKALSHGEHDQQVEELKNFDYEVKFNHNPLFDEKFESLIGGYYCNYNATLVEKIEFSQPKIVELDYHVNLICHIKDGQYIAIGTTDYGQNNFLALHDVDFKLIKKIKSINNEPLYVYNLACDKFGNVYLYNHQTNKLVKLDSDLNLKRSVKSKHKYDHHVHVNENCLYTHRAQSRSIDVYSLQLQFQFTHTLDTEMSSMKICENICFMTIAKSHGIYDTRFYRLPEFTPIEIGGPSAVVKMPSSEFVFYKDLLYALDAEASALGKTVFYVIDKNGNSVGKKDYFQKEISEKFMQPKKIQLVNNKLIFIRDTKIAVIDMK